MDTGLTTNSQQAIDIKVRMASIEDAEDLFIIAKNRLIDINNWHQVANTQTRFTLTDQHGRELHRHAHINDLLRITADSKMTRLHIDNIVYDDYPDFNDETFSLVFSLPDANQQQTAIIIERKDDTVKVYCHGPLIGELLNDPAGLLNGLLDFED